MNCLHSFRTENKLKSQEKVCTNKDICRIVRIVLPSKRIIYYMESDKMPYIFYTDIESLIKKIDGCANNPESSSTTKIDEHIP